MNTLLSLEERKQLVARAAHDFVRNSRPHEHPLSPYADSIVALREKDASYRIIADILHSAGVKVSHHSVARFCRDCLRIKPNKKWAARKRKKSRQSSQRTSQRIDSAQGTTSPQVPQKDALKLIARQREETHDPMSRPRRGPRIADPRNL